MKALRRLRINRGLTQAELAAMMNVEQTSISKWENGTNNPAREIEIKLAEFFGVSLDQLFGRESISINSEGKIIVPDLNSPVKGVYSITTKKFPMLGDISAGKPIVMQEEFESYVVAGSDIRADFCIRVRGDSMINARIQDGDIVFVRQQSDVENGQIAAVALGDEATLKRIYKNSDSIVLQAENPEYPPIIIPKSGASNIRILGLAIAFQSIVR